MNYKPAMVLLLSIVLVSCNNSSNEKQNESSANQRQKISTTEAVKIAEQKFNDYLPKILESHDAVLDIQEPHVGDFTGDGIEDVAIYFALSPKDGGNTMVGQGLTLYQNDGYDIKAIAGYEPDDLFTFDTIIDGKVYVEKLAYAKNDGRCCPSLKTKHVLTISGSKAY